MFPFIGAGAAGYYEYAEMFVCFESCPDAKQKKAIEGRIPPPLLDEVEWSGPLLRVASERGVNKAIRKAYEGRAEAFNSAIDLWLAAAHATLPIRVAYRRQDSEAGGTQLSELHHTSIVALPQIITALMRESDPEIATLGTRLVAEAGDAKIVIARNAAAHFERQERAREEQRGAARDAERATKEAAARAALGTPGAVEPPPLRAAAEFVAGLAALEKVMPATAKRLRAIAKKQGGLALRAPATEKALAAMEKKLGRPVSPEHRALLALTDGGVVGNVVVLGAAARGDASVAVFSDAWSGEARYHTIVARAGDHRVVTLPRGEETPIRILDGAPGLGGGSLTRQCKTLDTALELVFKAGDVPTNRGR